MNHECPPSYKADELYEKLLELGQPENEEPAVEECPIVIVDDETIAVAGVSLTLNPQKRFIFNALRLGQGEPQNGSLMRQLGWQGADSTFRQRLRELATEINDYAGSAAIASEGRSYARKYALSPDVRVDDLRGRLTPAERQLWFLSRHITLDEQGLPVIDGDGVVGFVSPTARLAVTRAMLSGFTGQDDWDLGLHRRLAPLGVSQPRSPRQPIRPIDVGGWETVPLEAGLLRQKEQALGVFVRRLDGNYTAEEKAVLMDGVRATFELFWLASGEARQVAWDFQVPDKMPFADVYQEAAKTLFEMVLKQPFDPTGLHVFRYIVFLHLRQTVPAAIRKRYWPALGRAALYDGERGGYAYQGDYAEAITGDFVDQELDRLELADAVGVVFSTKELNDKEKIAMSIAHELFSPSLCGAELRIGGEVRYTYPYTEEAFLESLSDSRIRSQRLRVLGISVSHGEHLLASGLRKARALFQERPELAERFGADEDTGLEARRQALVAMALKISPDKPLGSSDIRRLSAVGGFVSEREVEKCFESLLDFQSACGFEPDRGRQNRTMTADQIVELALTLKPDAPLSVAEVRILSKAGKFPGMTVVNSRFGGVRGLSKACGFL